MISYTSKELIKAYKDALKEISDNVASLYGKLQGSEPTKAQLTQFMRQSGIQDQLSSLLKPYLDGNKNLLGAMSMQGVDTGFFNNAWAVDQAVGVKQSWGMINEDAVRAVAGLGGDIGELSGVMSEKEVKRHTDIMIKAFTNYTKDSQDLLRQAVRQGIIQGESIQNVVKRIQDASGISYNSAMRIARTEILRSMSIGNLSAYDQARDEGVQIVETWDATHDSRTRADHGTADGTEKDNLTGMYSLFGTEFPAPRMSGIAGQDINCRCVSVGEIEGLSPELRALRDEGMEPYQTFQEWAESSGVNINRFGELYDFTGV